MNRSLLKDNAPLLVWLVRLVDPLLVIAGGLARASLVSAHLHPPEHYVRAMIGVAMLSFALFPLAGFTRRSAGSRSSRRPGGSRTHGW